MHLVLCTVVFLGIGIENRGRTGDVDIKDYIDYITLSLYTIGNYERVISIGATGITDDRAAYESAAVGSACCSARKVFY